VLPGEGNCGPCGVGPLDCDAFKAGVDERIQLLTGLNHEIADTSSQGAPRSREAKESARTPMGVRALVAALAALAMLAVVPSGASAYIYWANQRGEIGRANPDGTGVNRAFIKGVGSPQGLAIDSRHIYWANLDANSIGRANLNGTKVDPRFVTGAKIPQGVAVNGQYIFWANRGTDSIGRANLDGTGKNAKFVPGVSFPQGVAADAGYVYWADRNLSTIGRAEADGSGAPDPMFLGIPGSPDLDLMTVNATHIFWSDQAGGAIGRANLNGSGVDLGFVTGANKPLGVATDAKYLYWANNGASAIGRANLADGGAVNRSFITGVRAPIGLAVNAAADTKPPQTKITKHPPKKTKKHKVKFKFKSSEPNSTFECKLDKGKFKKCKSPKKYKRLKKGKHKFAVRAIDAAGNVDPTPARSKFKVKG
jgi:virginiamycin B lyase